MPRTVQISASPAMVGRIIQALERLDGIVAITVNRGTSLRPEGDAITVQATNEGHAALFRALESLGLDQGATIVTSEPRSLIARRSQEQIDDETNEASPEEMGSMLRRETNVTNNYLLAMGLSGGVAAAGLWTEALHIVVGAMVIAPGFEPLLRIPFGLIGERTPRLRRGLVSTAAGYGALAVGAAVTTWILMVIDPAPGSRLSQNEWIQFWSTVQPTGVLIALLASVAGMAIIAAQRSVLSAGVMIALALIPAMSIVGMGVATWNLPLAGLGLLRWAVDAACVIAAGAAVVALKRALIHRRGALG